MTDIRLLYITTKDLAEAQTIAHELLRQRLIACANIVPGMLALYHWHGEAAESTEAILIAKTTVKLAADATAAALKLHSYDTPCVLELPIESGASGYLNWLRNEVENP